MNLLPWKRKEIDAGLEMQPRSLNTLRNEFDRLFDRFFTDFDSGMPELFGNRGNWLPAFEVSETENEVLVRAELPGVNANDVEVTVSGNVLTVSGEKREETEHREGVTYRSERRFGRFQRSIELPATVDADKVSAENANGVLTIRLSRSEASKPKRIKVNST